MKHKSNITVLTALLLIVGILLTGCTGAAAPTEPPTEPPTEAPTEAPAEAPTEAPAEPTEDPTVLEEDLARNPLNGHVIEGLHTNRTFAVVFNNAKPAIPQHGISQADMLFEFLAEGGITRCVGLFSNIQDVEVLGSVRSARKYFVSLAQAFDAVLVHAGGSDEALIYIENNYFDDIDGIKGYAGSFFYRDQARKEAGYAKEHTLFTSGAGLSECSASRGQALERPDGVNFGLLFDEDVQLEGETAETINITYLIGEKTTKLTYDAEADKYLSHQYKDAWIDGETNEQLAYTNAMVLFADTSYQDDHYLLTINLIGSGKGYFACGGKLVPINWQRSSESGMFFFTYEDGTPITLEVGNTYVSVVPTGSQVSWE